MTAATSLGPEATAAHLSAHFGGSPANVAVGLARLDISTGFAGRLAAGGFGPWLRGHLERNGVDLSYAVDAAEPATLALVSLDEAGRASYTFYGPETADWQWHPDELPPPESLDAAVVHTGSLATLLDPGASVVRRWVAAIRQGGRTLISIDPNVRPALVQDRADFAQALDDLVAQAHVVKVSEEDLAFLPGSSEATAERWLASGCDLVVITRGGDGASALHRGGARVDVPAPVVEVADTVGAGDSFTAGLLGYLADHDLLQPAAVAELSAEHLADALSWATRVSAITCTRPGANPPFRAELR
jgi:fructokinase